MQHRQATDSGIFFLVGTYTTAGKTDGIHVFHFDTSSGEIKVVNSIKNAESPSFLTISSNRNFLYAVNEIDARKGGISAFSLKAESAGLVFLNHSYTGGDHPCHVVADSTNSHLLVSNYSGGSLSVFKINSDGTIGGRVQLMSYEGSSTHPTRQLQPHVHSAILSPDEKHLFVQDLGTDKMYIYEYNSSNPNTPLNELTVKHISFAPGNGPRLLTFSSDGKFVYLVQELTAHICVLAHENGTVKEIQQVSMVEEGFLGEVCAAHLEVSFDGKFLYASNRGEANDICVLKINETDGTLTKITNRPVEGRGPRHFTLSPNNQYIFVANQQTHQVIVFERDAQSGTIGKIINHVEVESPVCLLLL